MICLKKELLRAYASSSSISVLCVITLWQRSNAWQGQSSVQDKFCSKQTQPLLQTDLPLHVHTRSCKKSDDIWPSNNIGSRPNFPSFQPCSRGYPTAGFGICAFNHFFVWYEDLRTCCLNVSSLAIGVNITKVESLTVANFARNLFRSIWHRYGIVSTFPSDHCLAFCELQHLDIPCWYLKTFLHCLFVLSGL